MAAYGDDRSYLALAIPITISDDFWAGWISGVLGVMAGNPLDRRKVQLQSAIQSLPTKPTLSEPPQSSRSSIAPPVHSQRTSPSSSLIAKYFPVRSPLAGAAAPSLSVGILNALLYMIYNRTEEAFNHSLQSGTTSQTAFASSSNSVYSTTGSNLWTTWLAGAAGGLVTSVVNTPTELVKCRAQLASLPATYESSTSSSQNPAPGVKPPLSSWNIAKTIWQVEGTRGLFHGGVVTALRDSIGYGFYFWAYELGDRVMTGLLTRSCGGGITAGLGDTGSNQSNLNASTNLPLLPVAGKDILCGGIAGVVTWASIFPLDVVKTRVQEQSHTVTAPATGDTTALRRGAIEITRELYAAGGSRAFFRGLAVCSVRAFFVNAVQWPVYKWTMSWLSHKSRGRED